MEVEEQLHQRLGLPLQRVQLRLAAVHRAAVAPRPAVRREHDAPVDRGWSGPGPGPWPGTGRLVCPARRRRRRCFRGAHAAPVAVAAARAVRGVR